VFTFIKRLVIVYAMMVGVVAVLQRKGIIALTPEGWAYRHNTMGAGEIWADADGPYAPQSGVYITFEDNHVYARFGDDTWIRDETFIHLLLTKHIEYVGQERSIIS